MSFWIAQNQAVPGPAAPVGLGGGWRDAPEYTAMFVPRVYRDDYRAFTSPLSLDTVLRLVTGNPAPDETLPPGAWHAHAENPLDAFGMGGTYDRWKISRLYGSRRPVVARGPRGHQGIVEESWTFISPYPSADLERLEPGTLLIVLRVP